MPADRIDTEALPPRQRSAVTNGRRRFIEGDGRSAWSRRFRDLISAHVSDLGGVPAISAAQLSLIRRASAIEIELERMEGKLAQDEAVDFDLFSRATGHLRRVLETLGLERRARDVTDIDPLVYAKQRVEAAE
jgi:hypothetical protein